MTEAKKTDDAEVLFSDEPVEVAGETVTVREFRYLEGLRAAAVARPILAALRELMDEFDTMAPESIDALIGEHHDAWVQLLAMSTDKDPEWVKGLPDREGLELSMVFWRVNGPFFTRRLILAGAMQRGLDSLSRSPSSSPNSSQPDSLETTKTSPSA